MLLVQVVLKMLRIAIKQQISKWQGPGVLIGKVAKKKPFRLEELKNLC